MLDFSDRVVIRNRLETVNRLGLQPDQKALMYGYLIVNRFFYYFYLHCFYLIFYSIVLSISVHDVYCRHRDSSYLEHLNKNNILYTFVPANRTDDLQFHDFLVNKLQKQGNDELVLLFVYK